jgi:adenosine deaminase
VIPQRHPEPDLKAFLGELEKSETHLHFEGALPWELLNGLDPDSFPTVPASWSPDFRFSSFAHFEQELLAMAMPWFTSPERYHTAAKVLFKRLQEEENVTYVETSFASGVLEYLQLDGAAVASAIKAAAPAGLKVKVYLGIHHNGYTERARPFLEESLGWEQLDGIDLHGTETLPLEPWTADFWERARKAGKETKAHAGEFCGPEFVERVIDELGVRRIQHGVRAIEDPRLVRRLASEGIILDICPISNVKLAVVPSMDRHPIKELLQAGVYCTVSTDDPISFGNTPTDEYTALAQDLGFSQSDLIAVAKNGLGVGEQPGED